MNLSSQKKAPETNNLSDNMIDMKSLFSKVFETKESANDDHHEALNQQNDKSLHYVDTKGDLAELDNHVETNMGKGGGSGSKKTTTSKIIEMATGKERIMSDGEKTERAEAEREATLLKSTLEQENLQGKMLGLFGGAKFRAMSVKEKIAYLNDLRKKDFKEVWKESEGFWGTIKTLILWRGAKAFALTKKGKTVLDLAEKAEVIADKTEAITDKVESGMRKADEMIDNTQQGLDSIRENPAVGQLASKYNQQMRDLWRGADKHKPQEIARLSKKIMGETIKEGYQKYGKSFLKSVDSRKFQGFNIRGTGRHMMVEVLSRGVMDGFREGSSFTDGLRKAGETITDSSTLKEAIPGVGSFKSLKRLFSDNGDPLKLKLLDAGLNVTGDLVLAAGVVASTVSFGATAAAGLAARGSLLAVSKSVLKKQALVKGVQSTGKVAGKTVISTGKWTALTMGIEKAYRTYFPTDKIVQYSVATMKQQLLTPKQQVYAEKFGMV